MLTRCSRPSKLFAQTLVLARSTTPDHRLFGTRLSLTAQKEHDAMLTKTPASLSSRSISSMIFQCNTIPLVAAAPKTSHRAFSTAATSASPSPSSSSPASPSASPARALSIPDTVVQMTMLLEPSMTDDEGHLLPGQLLKWMDVSCSMSAERFAGRPCVTAAMDDVILNKSARRGDIVTVVSQVNHAFGSSMEIGCKVYVENAEIGVITHICSAYFTFVATPSKDGGKPRLPPLAVHPASDSPQSPLLDEHIRNNQRRWNEAKDRRSLRLLRKSIIEQAQAEEHTRSLIAPDPHTGSTITATPAPITSPTPSSASVEVSAAQGSLAPASRATLEWLSGRLRQQPAQLSTCEDTQLVLPTHANHVETCFGGQLMSWIVSACTIAAFRFTRQLPMMKGIDDIYFFTPIRVGDRVVIKSQVNRSFTSTFEVGCRVERLSPNGELAHALTAYMIFESPDRSALRVELTPSTGDEKRRWSQAYGRQQVRLKRNIIRSHAQLTAK